MSALADITELGTLRDKAEHVRGLIAPAPLRPAGEDAEQIRQQRRRVYAEVEDGILDLSNVLPQGTEDYDVRKLLEFLVGLRRAIEADPDGTDPRGEVELHKLMMGDVLRRIDRRLLHDQLDDPRAAADYLFTTLDRVPAGDLARLLGVSTKTIGAWKAGRPVARNVERVVVLAQLVSYLRPSLTPLGIVLWFDAPRDQLAGRTPLDRLDHGVAAAREPLVSLARGARGQLAG